MAFAYKKSLTISLRKGALTYFKRILFFPSIHISHRTLIKVANKSSPWFLPHEIKYLSVIEAFRSFIYILYFHKDERLLKITFHLQQLMAFHFLILCQILLNKHSLSVNFGFYWEYFSCCLYFPFGFYRTTKLLSASSCFVWEVLLGQIYLNMGLLQRLDSSSDKPILSMISKGLFLSLFLQSKVPFPKNWFCSLTSLFLLSSWLSNFLFHGVLFQGLA